MFNTTSRRISGYTDRYVYFDGWQDFFVTSEQEFNSLCKYAFFAYETLDVFISDSSGINSSNFSQKYTDAAKDFGTNSIEMNFRYDNKILGGINGLWLEVTLSFTNGTELPPTESNESSFKNYTDQKYFKLQTKTRADDYNGFTTETSVIEVPVSNTNQLFMCAQDGGKPVFAENNYEAQESYERAKEILRNIISDDMTDFEKALAIYDYINSTMVYDSEYTDGNFNNRRYWLNGPLLSGVGVCDGFSKLYSRLCNMEGIKVINITGYANGDHAWNMIYLDTDNDGIKEWHNVDATWDGSVKISENGETYELSVHKNFLLTDEEFTNHLAYIKYQYTTVDCNYYQMYEYQEGKDLYITSIDEMKDYLSFLKTHTEEYNGRDIYVNVLTEDGEGNSISMEVSDVIAQASSTFFGINFQYITTDTNYVLLFKK